MLLPEQYDSHEREALKVHPNRIIEAFQPEIFNLVGYPVRITSLRELYRYVDVMHETGFPGILEVFLKGLTDEEFELLKEVTDRTKRITAECCAKSVIPRSSLLWALLALRHVRALFPDRSATICEVGPGSGYLGALLGLLGYNYVSTDVSQAFYLWQNLLWEQIFGDRLVELASRSEPFSDFQRIKDSQLLHVPWWKFSSPDPEAIKLDLDCIVCIDVIAEMHVFAMRYLGRQAARWLRLSSGNNVLYVQGTGAQLRRSMTDIVGALQLMGLPLAHSDRMDLPEKYAPHDMFYFFVPHDRPYQVDAQLKDRSIKNAIERKRSEYFARAKVATVQVKSLHKEITGTFENDTDDERFWNFCNGQEWKWY